ncbi:MAG: hypothetical protein J5J06_00880 [Phycisphaerae bacterium]|nr:hypothetical protein [Phycisphaerae bacterium]
MHVHDEHDHDHDHGDHLNPGDDAPFAVEEPLDAANQSLADALRASFSILKGIMLVLVILYLFSNVRTVDTSEQALVLRLGRLLPNVRDPGLVWGYPFPIDEIVPLPTRKSNEVVIDSHTFHRTANEREKPLAMISRSEGEGLNPTLDGALLTADAGLVHVRWKVTYKIDDVARFVSNIMGDQTESADDLIRVLVETIGIQLASGMTAEEVTRTRVDDLQTDMLRELNDHLRQLESGVTVTLVEVFEPTPPLQIRGAFDETQREENNKSAKINQAVQDRTKLLNEAAGVAHRRVIAVLDDLAAAEPGSARTEALQKELDRLLVEDVEGKAGRIVKDATALMSIVVDRMRGDVELYRTLVPEYERNPILLIERLWEEARMAIFNEPGVIKFYRPMDSEFRLKIPLDPEQKKIEEKLRLQQQDFSPEDLRERRWEPLPVGVG